MTAFLDANATDRRRCHGDHLRAPVQLELMSGLREPLRSLPTAMTTDSPATEEELRD